jgi:glucokinase
MTSASAPPASHGVAIDLGGTRLRAAIVRPDGSLGPLHCDYSHPEQGQDALVARLRAAVWAALAAATLAPAQVQGVVIACPGPVDRAAGVVLDAANLGWRDVPLRALLADLPWPVRIDKDSALAALGESLAGAGRAADPLVYLSLGTGIGLGIVQGGAVLHGAHGWAGELGHIVVRRRGRRCACGQRGCLETILSGPGLAATAAALDGAAWTSESVVAAAQAGHPVARRACNQTGRALGWACALLAHLLDPARIVIGGGLSAALPLLLPAAARELARRNFHPGRPLPPLVPAQLGDAAALVGAARLLFPTEMEPTP